VQSIFPHYLKSAKADFAKSVVGFHSFLLICERLTHRQKTSGEEHTACRACSKNKRLAAEAKSIGGRAPSPLCLLIAAALVSASGGAARASVRANHDHPVAL